MLVSATENIDETPSGMLLHGIMSTIAEFYSRNLANEVAKGVTQKAATGGTVGRAPIGYLNVHKRDELGRDVPTVDLDPDRAARDPRLADRRRPDRIRPGQGTLGGLPGSRRRHARDLHEH